MGEAVAGDDTIHHLSLFTKRTLMCGNAEVAIEVICIEYRVNGNTITLINGRIDGSKACDGAAVVLDRIHSYAGGTTGRNRGCEDEDILSGNSGDRVIAEDKSACCHFLGGKNVYGLMRVKIHEAAVGKTLSHTGSYNLHLIETKDGIYNCAVVVIGYELLCDCTSLRKSGLLHRYINVIIHMTVSLHKVTLSHAKEKVLSLGSYFV